jgi:hypothetical protein
MINLNAPVLDQHIRMIVLDLRSMFLHKDLDRPSQNASALFGDPHHMIVMRIRTMGTEGELPCTSVITNRSFCKTRLQQGALSPTGSRPVVLRANFDKRKKREELIILGIVNLIYISVHHSA